MKLDWLRNLLKLAGGAKDDEERSGVKIIFGLGNPGLRYEGTRHNVGFRVVQELGIESGAEFKSAKNLYAEVAKTTVSGENVLLVMPTTYMNLSGKSFLAVCNWYKVPRSDVLVIHDDVALSLGRIRLQKNGGAGGQHGVESIIESLGGDKVFDRLKIGVGPDPGGDRRADYVLAQFPPAQAPLLSSSLALANRAVLLWLEKGINFAMNACNGIDLAEVGGEVDQ